MSSNVQDPPARNEEHAKGWKPDPDDRLVGVVEELGSRDAGFGRYPIVTVRCAEGASEGGEAIPVGEQRALHGTGAVLAEELTTRQPGIGDEMDVTYLGKKGERGYRAYKFGDAAPFSWADFGGTPKADEPDMTQVDTSDLAASDDDIPF